MNLEVSEENVCKVLQDVRELLKDNILPRLTQLEEEVRLLREVTWPVCQSLIETSQLSDTHNKRRFLNILDEVEARKLLVMKSDVSRLPLKYSTFHLLVEELTHASQ